MEMNGRRAGADVGAVVFAGEGIDGIVAEITFLGGLRDGRARGFGKGHLVVAHRTVHIEQHAAGVLAERLRLLFGQRNVLVDDLDGIGGDGALLFRLQRGQNGLMNIVGNLGRRAADQFDQ